MLPWKTSRFQKSGLWPFNPEVVLNGNRGTIVPKKEKEPESKRGKRLNINGKVITSIEDVNAMYAELKRQAKGEAKK